MAPLSDRDAKIAPESEPYLSLVVTARNDDHGGNLLGRMQIFVNGWLEQARRYNIPSELIIVEWNPPADRPPLAKALRWSAEIGPCEVRIIQVPPEVHERHAHAASLPLYQMIAKNVGIRRARGQFILATNIDILFSNELAEFLGSRQLRTDRMYRIDRYDAMSNVPHIFPILLFKFLFHLFQRFRSFLQEHLNHLNDEFLIAACYLLKVGQINFSRRIFSVCLLCRLPCFNV